MIRADGGDAGGERKAKHRQVSLSLDPRLKLRWESVQYEANINHISKNNIPAVLLPFSPSPLLPSMRAASPGACSIKHSPSEGVLECTKARSRKRRGGVSGLQCNIYCGFFPSLSVNKDNC